MAETGGLMGEPIRFGFAFHFFLTEPPKLQGTTLHPQTLQAGERSDLEIRHASKEKMVRCPVHQPPFSVTLCVGFSVDGSASEKCNSSWHLLVNVSMRREYVPQK